MESTTFLVNQLASSELATPNRQIISFQAGDDFRWDPKSSCIFYNPSVINAPQLLLHELGHALLGHSNYHRDIELLEMERQAWNKAVELSTRYKLVITDDLIENHLDTYRDWLHARSLCPNCGATGLQTAQSNYSCLSCAAKWRVNQARTCGLKRYKTK